MVTLTQRTLIDNILSNTNREMININVQNILKDLK